MNGRLAAQMSRAFKYCGGAARWRWYMCFAVVFAAFVWFRFIRFVVIVLPGTVLLTVTFSFLLCPSNATISFDVEEFLVLRTYDAAVQLDLPDRVKNECRR